MAWVKVDDKLHSHPKWEQTTLRARGLWATALSWSNDQLTDGHVPDFMLRRWGATKADARNLVAVGLWELDNGEFGGYWFHDYHDYNPSAETVRSKRKAEADRKAKARAAAAKEAEKAGKG